MEGAKYAIEIKGVTRRFGANVALDNVSLLVPSGSVFGLVGENGAGKTTLIKHVMGLMKPQTGSVTVLGGDPIADPVGILSRIGYLNEEVDLPSWMRVHELLRYTESFYPTWDAAYAQSLRVQFGLELGAKLRDLSKGQRARAGLLAALAYKPDLLVLDEPSSGLDPIVRRDILGAIIRTIAEEGRTVLFSSHLLSEVEQVSDRVALIRAGKVVFCDSLDAIKELHHRITIRFSSPRSTPPEIPGAFGWEGEGLEWTTIWTSEESELTRCVTELGAQVVDRAGLTLDEIFIARVGPASVGREAQ